MHNYLNALLSYQCITPLHVGCGQEVGVVDLPVIRERATGYPFIPGSGIRGSLRDIFENEPNYLCQKLFGPDNSEEVDYAGCLAIHDSHLLLFPVRADKQVFCWLTCPMVLQRWNRDLDAFKIHTDNLKFMNAEKVSIGEDKFIGPSSLESKIH